MLLPDNCFITWWFAVITWYLLCMPYALCPVIAPISMESHFLKWQLVKGIVVCKKKLLSLLSLHSTTWSELLLSIIIDKCQLPSTVVKTRISVESCFVWQKINRQFILSGQRHIHVVCCTQLLLQPSQHDSYGSVFRGICIEPLEIFRLYLARHITYLSINYYQNFRMQYIFADELRLPKVDRQLRRHVISLFWGYWLKIYWGTVSFLR